MNVPAVPSTAPYHIASGVASPIVSLCDFLSLVVNATTSDDFSIPCAAVVAPAQRTACSDASVLHSESTFVLSSVPSPFASFHSPLSPRATAAVGLSDFVI